MAAQIEISLKPETLFDVAGFSVTNSMLWTSLIAIILMVVFVFTARRLKEVPGRLQLFIETFVVGAWDFVHGIFKDEKLTARAFPMFATLALFFLCANLFSFIPGLGVITVSDAPLYRSPATNYSLIFVLTFANFIIWQLIAIVSGGFFGYAGKFFNFSGGNIMERCLNFALGLLDIIGEIAKIVSLSFRLFGNIFAGEVISAVMLSIAPLFIPIPFWMLGLLSSVIQAFVFPILIVIFFQMAIITKEKTTETAS
ncbi:MAG: hypothetical protein COW24_01655 [Candidatus Kerfeldbacteria bacterium CG15_BIG_FIL_POST_REV_8_21_14_020_45_12]|uniref:ATP synthase subunit a n=1 Tax=Candidatus Kerfeldbacteria bacterium CG15_BIG_FIL_POST_REV_8_21_14_020_45_12 TaxID=2014247 RepID=A0A2M7H4J6_9BACT|nr:MAG: hypothetical protein COW24_01655 [Candidatus Kerfeldbacteria bacterium CG15_BIG_FIL_POST_REV_8_21_14_020_45_12]PJA92928.1 MAG: hypothetical protein CO132_05465 [Candidatus Kerfeldbacteria bacterium CG_4_9_14_3_um_filter_45_8]